MNAPTLSFHGYLESLNYLFPFSMDNSCRSLIEGAVIQPGWTDSCMEERFGIIFDVVASITCGRPVDLSS